ncbi:MAG: FecR family protein, partial [Xanthomonadales bacterium]|nr:FecR family protein [Xanthomonadales bacterium]
MSDSKQNPSKGTADDRVGQLIRRVGGREPVAPERLERSRRVVEAHWQQVLASQPAARSAPRLRWLTAAASTVLVAGLAAFLVGRQPVPPPSGLATVERLIGTATQDGRPLARGTRLDPGSWVETADTGLLALRMSDGQSLRLDSGSRVQLHAPNHVALHAGAVYIDSDFAATGDWIRVETPLGSARDIGTQFQVRLLASEVVVGVREGLVVVEQEGMAEFEVNEGFAVSFAEGGGPDMRELDVNSAEWRWIESVT